MCALFIKKIQKSPYFFLSIIYLLWNCIQFFFHRLPYELLYLSSWICTCIRNIVSGIIHSFINYHYMILYYIFITMIIVLIFFFLVCFVLSLIKINVSYCVRIEWKRHTEKEWREQNRWNMEIKKKKNEFVYCLNFYTEIK